MKYKILSLGPALLKGYHFENTDLTWDQLCMCVTHKSYQGEWVFIEGTKAHETLGAKFKGTLWDVETISKHLIASGETKESKEKYLDDLVADAHNDELLIQHQKFDDEFRTVLQAIRHQLKLLILTSQNKNGVLLSDLFNQG